MCKLGVTVFAIETERTWHKSDLHLCGGGYCIGCRHIKMVCRGC